MRQPATKLRKQDPTFVAAVNDALQGLERLAIPAEDLLLALADDGTPCSPEE